MNFSKTPAVILSLLLTTGLACAQESDNGDLWSGESGILEHRSSPNMILGEKKKDDVVISVDLSHVRTGVVAEDYLIASKRGTGTPIKKGSLAYAVELKLNNRERVPSTVNNSVEWCIIRDLTEPGKKEKKDSYCVIKRGENEGEFIEPATDFLYNPVFLWYNDGPLSGLPPIIEHDVDFGVHFRHELRIQKISNRELTLNWIETDGKEDRAGLRSKAQDYRWSDDDTAIVQTPYGKLLFEKIDRRTVVVSQTDTNNATDTKLPIVTSIMR